jgi:hypothetical protein
VAFFSKNTSILNGKYIAYTPSAYTSSGSTAPQTVAQNGSNPGTSVTIGTFQPLRDPFGRGRTTYSISGDLPPGISFTNGVISGQTVLGAVNSNSATYRFSVTATEIFPGSAVSSSITRDFELTVTTPWLYRQVITTAYMMGGYKNSSLWSNTNRLVMATDTASNLGDGTIDNFHYKAAAVGDSKVYVFNGTTTAFNMRTESKSNSGSSPGSAGNNGVVYDTTRTYAWVNGEGTGQIKRWTFATEGVSNVGSGWNDHAASISGEYRGIFWGNSGQTQRIIYSTESVANMGYSAGAHGQQKGLSGKTGYGYGGAQGDYAGGNQFRRTNIESETQSNTYTKPYGNCGEENYTQGQTHGYMLGQYNGAQNNLSFKYAYSTDSGTTGSSTMEPKGHDGASSGAFGFRD